MAGEDARLDATLGLDNTEALASVEEVKSAVDDATTASLGGGDTGGGLADSLTRTSGAAKEASDAMGITIDRAAALGGAAGVATGGLDGLGGALHVAGAAGIAAGAGIGALATGADKLFEAGVQATSAGQRFTTIIGSMGKAVEEVHVGTLSSNMKELGNSFGSTEAEMQNAAANIFQIGKNAGLTSVQSAEMTKNIEALAARSVALKPSLGDVSNVMDTMSLRLARGGVFAQRLGISLTATEISSTAAQLGLQKVDGQLSQGEKTYAASVAAAEKYANTIGKDVADGANNAANVQKQLNATVKEYEEQAGKALVTPMFDLIRASLPSVKALADVLGQLAKDALPAVTDAAKAVAIPLEAVAGAMGHLAPIVTAGVEGWLAYVAVAKVIPGLMNLVAGGMEVAAGATVRFGAGIETAAGEVAGASEVVSGAGGWVGLLVGGLTLAASAFGIFGGGAKQAAVDTGSFADAVQKANGAIGDEAQKAAVDVFKKQGDALHTLAEGGVKVTDVLAGISGGTKNTNKDLHNLTETVQLLSDVQAGDWNRSMADAGLVETNQAESTKILNTRLQEQIKTLREGAPALADVVDRLQQQGRLTPDVVTSLAALDDAYKKGQISAKDLAKAAGDVAGANNDVQQSAADAAKSIKDMADAMKGAADSYLNQWQATVKVSEATIAADESYKSYTDAVKQHGATSVEATKASDDLQTKVIDLSNAVRDATLVQHQNEDQATATMKATQAQIFVLEAEKQKYPELAPVIDAYIAKLQSIPGVVPTTVVFDNTGALVAADQYIAKLGQVDAAIRNMPKAQPIFSPTFSITPGPGTPIPGHPGEFTGQHGLLVPGRPGEAVPVLAHAGERILSVDETRQSQASGAITVTSTFVNQAPIYGVDQLEDTVTKLLDAHDDKLALALRSKS